jgi:uncharacterized membrane protein
MNTLNKTKTLTLTGLMTAAVTVATIAIIIPVPNTGGYIHAGDSMVFLSVLVLGWRYGAMAAGLGSALADIISGYAQWAPATLVIKTLMAVLMGLAIEKAMKSKRNTTLVAMAIACVWLVFNFLTVLIVKQTASVDPSVFTSDTVGVGQVPALVSTMESQMMVVSLIIPLLLVAIAVYIRKKHKIVSPIYHILGITLAGFWMVFGYFVAGGVMYGNFAVSALSIPMNVIQFCVGFFLAELIWAGIGKFVKQSL